MVLLSPEWTDLMFQNIIWYLSKSSTLTEKDQVMTSTNLRKKISKFMHLYWWNTWAEKIVHFFLVLLRHFAVVNSPTFFVWFGYQTEKKLNYSPSSSANKYVD